MSCAATAIYNMNGCQQPGSAATAMHFSSAGRQLRDLPEEVSVSCFNTASHLPGPKHPSVFIWVGFPGTGYVVRLGDTLTIPLLRTLYPSES